MKKWILIIALTILLPITSYAQMGPPPPIALMADCSGYTGVGFCRQGTSLYYFNGTSAVELASGSGFSVTDITGQTDDTTPATTATAVLAQGGSLIESTIAQIMAAGETDPIVKAINGVVCSNGTTIAACSNLTDTLKVADPGSPERGDIFYTGASGTARLPHATAGNPLISGGNGADPSFLGIVLTGGTNTFNVTNGTASLDVAAGAAVNIDTGLTVQTGAVTITGNVAGSTLVLPSGSISPVAQSATDNCIYGRASDVEGCYATMQLDDSAAQFKSATASKGDFKIDVTGVSDTKHASLKPVCTDDCIISTPSRSTNGTLVDTDSTQTLTGKSITAVEVDGHTDQTALTAAQVSGTVIYNTGQGAADVFLLLPTAAAGYSFVATVGTAQAYHFGVEAGANDKIYLLAAAGTIAAGDDAAGVVMIAAQVGQAFSCWTFKTDAYDWMCKAIAIGTSTFEAHAHSTP